MKSRAERGVSDRVYARLITLNRWVIYCMFSTIEPWLLLVRVLMYTEAYVHVPQPVQAGGESPDHQDHEWLSQSTTTCLEQSLAALALRAVAPLNQSACAEGKIRRSHWSLASSQLWLLLSPLLVGYCRTPSFDSIWMWDETEKETNYSFQCRQLTLYYDNTVFFCCCCCFILH